MGFLSAPGKLLQKIPGVKTLNKPVNSALRHTPGLRGVPNKIGMGGPVSKPTPTPMTPSVPQVDETNANSQGQGFAQQAPLMQKMPAPMMNPQLGDGGSRNMIQAKQLALKNRMNATNGGAIGGNFSQMLGAHPELQAHRQAGINAGQDMSWMDQPGALSMAPSQPVQEQAPQSGLANLQTPYEQQQNPIPEVQGGIGPSNPMQYVEMDENGLEPRRGAR